MKIAICLVGQLRTFSDVYESLISNLVKPLQESSYVSQVDIFIYGTTFTKSDYINHFDKIRYSSKLEIDKPGAETIIKKCPHITKVELKTFSDNTINYLMTKINLDNKPNFHEILCTKSIQYHKTDRFYKLFYLGMSQHYNNMNAFRKVDNSYDIIIRTRPDMRYLNKKLSYYVIDYIKKERKMYSICLTQKNELWDQIFFGKATAMKLLYDNFDSKMIYFCKGFMNGSQRRSENMLQNFVREFSKKYKKKINWLNLKYQHDYTRDTSRGTTLNTR